MQDNLNKNEEITIKNEEVVDQIDTDEVDELEEDIDDKKLFKAVFNLAKQAAILGCVAIGWMYLSNKNQEKEIKLDSLEAMKETVVLKAKEDVEYKIPFGEKVVDAEIEKLFEKSCGEYKCELIFDSSDVNTSKEGVYKVKGQVIASDSYNQEYKTDVVAVEVIVENQIKPNIEFKDNTVDIGVGNLNWKPKDNIQAVYDEELGDYKYNSNKADGTYWVDDSELNRDEAGKYEIKVIAYKNGIETVETFTVSVNKGEIHYSNNNNQTVSPNGQSTQKADTYHYVDEYGNVYTQEQIDAIVASGQLVEIQDLDKIYYLTNWDDKTGTGIERNTPYDEGEAKCLASWGKWDGEKCVYPQAQ